MAVGTLRTGCSSTSTLANLATTVDSFLADVQDTKFDLPIASPSSVISHCFTSYAIASNESGSGEGGRFSETSPSRSISINGISSGTRPLAVERISGPLWPMPHGCVLGALILYTCPGRQLRIDPSLCENILIS